MAKQFKKIIMASSNEVSLCSKYNSGANKQTEFELVKDKDGVTNKDVRPTIEKLVKFIDFYGEELEPAVETDILQNFKEFLNYWLEYDVNNCLYNLLNESLMNQLNNISYLDVSKEQKVDEYEKLFNLFIEEYKNMPITKTEDGKYEVSLVSTSRIQECGTNPQNETTDITKETTSEMKTEEQKTMFEQALDLLKSAFGCLEKTETPAEETQEVQPPVEAEETETPAEAPAEEVAEVEPEDAPAEETQEEPQEGEPAEVEAPVVEEAEEIAQEEAPVEEAPAEIEKTGESIEEIIKQKLDLEKELDELKKAQAEKEETIEKMSFIQKAKDEFSMLVGTPEEIGEKLYSISKSNLTEDAKEFIMEQLKKVSVENRNLTDELGSITKDAGELTDEEVIYQKAENIAKTKGISVKKALREIK